MIKNWYKYLVYISIIFLILYLVKSDILHYPIIYHFHFLIISFILLFLAFVFQSLNWYYILKTDSPISLKDAISSVGITVFTKYIPGKVLVILGKAGYINLKYKYPNKSLIIKSIYIQLIVFWSGILVGCIGLLVINNNYKWMGVLLIAFTFLTLFIFTKTFHNFLKETYFLITKKEINIYYIPLTKVTKVLPVTIIYWVLLSFAFYFLSQSLTENNTSSLIGFGFPLAAIIGILAIISPGGIGVREGILVTYLTLTGMDLQTATLISVTSRLWFLIGEFFIFSLGFVLHKFFSSQ